MSCSPPRVALHANLDATSATLPLGVRMGVKNSFLHFEAEEPRKLRHRCFSEGNVGMLGEKWDNLTAEDASTAASDVEVPAPSPLAVLKASEPYGYSFEELQPQAPASYSDYVYIPAPMMGLQQVHWTSPPPTPEYAPMDGGWSDACPLEYTSACPTPPLLGTPPLQPLRSECSTPDLALDSQPATSPPLTPREYEREEPKKKKKRGAVPEALPNEITLMLRNLPDNTADSLLKAMWRYKRDIDFFYLPINFDTEASLGYAFVNFCRKDRADEFMADVLQGKLPLLDSGEVAVQPARVQGYAANVKRFRHSSVMAVLKPCHKPRLFENGEPRPFPSPAKKLPPVGPRFRPVVMGSQ